MHIPFPTTPCHRANTCFIAAGPVYIGEMAPAEIRGYIMAFWQTFYSVGSFIAYWINC